MYLGKFLIFEIIRVKTFTLSKKLSLNFFDISREDDYEYKNIFSCTSVQAPGMGHTDTGLQKPAI